MLRTLILMGGLFGLTLPAPAQLQVHARFGKHVSIGVDLPGHAHRAPVYCPPQPAGEWRTVEERVWVAGECRTIVHPAVWGWSRDCHGHRVWTIVCPERREVIHEPGRWECRTKQVWVPRCR